jgi:hypothetical protein
MKKKGFYIKKGKDQSLYLNVFTSDFVVFLSELETEWVKLRIYERDTIDEKGHTHNMEIIPQKELQKD